MIARTEHARAVNAGTLQAYANYGVEYVDIITAGDDLVCYICREIESDSPIPLKEAMKLFPAHPNCRCAWSAHIDSMLPSIPIDNPIIVNSTFKKNYEDLEITEDIANFYGLEYEYDPVEQTHHFRDNLYDTDIYFDDFFETSEGKDLVDFNNIREGYLNPKEIIKAYIEAEPIYKYCTPKITFSKSSFYLGQTGIEDGEQGNITIHANALVRGEDVEYDSFELTLYHEMFHAVDINIRSFEQGINPIENISSNPEWHMCESDDLNYQEYIGYQHVCENGAISEYGSTDSCENAAETFAAVACIRKGDCNPNVGGRDRVSGSEFIVDETMIKERHKNKFNYANDTFDRLNEYAKQKVRNGEYIDYYN